MNLNRAMDYIIHGKALLFLGSGFSKGAVNINNEGFKDANELTRKLFSVMNIPYDPAKDLNIVSEYFQNKKGKSQLIDLLKKEYTVKEVSNTQKEIMKYDWERVYTTNYDDIAEKASKENGILREPITLSTNLKEVKDKDEVVVHLNGFIKNITEDTLRKELKLTKRSYVIESFEENQWATLFKKDIEHAKVIIFIGYSLSYDIDLQRIMINSNAIRDKIFFINGQVDEMDRVIIEQYGNLEPLYSDEFAKVLANKEKEMSVREN